MRDKIQNVKVGDLVFVYYNRTIHLAPIQKITPKGFIRVDGTLYDEYGSQKGGDAWYRSFIRVPSPEEIEEYNKRKFIAQVIGKLQKLKTDDVDYETAVSINDLLFNEVEK